MDIPSLFAALQPLIETLHPRAYAELVKDVMTPKSAVDYGKMTAEQALRWKQEAKKERLESLLFPDEAEVFQQLADNTYMTMPPGWSKETRITERKEPMKKQIFTIYKVDNGFLGELPSGGLVIGATLSEVCSAAQAQAATNTLLQDDDAVEQDAGKASWQRLSKP